LALDRNSQAVKLVKPNLLHGPGLSISEDYGLADKFSLSLLELAEDDGGVFVSSWLGRPGVLIVTGLSARPFQRACGGMLRGPYFVVGKRF
jgi:hypothetical protein